MLTFAEVAEKEGVSTRTVWRWVRVGLGRGVKLAATKRGQTWYVKPADLDAFFRKLTRAALA